jgi:hypothetical protein
MKTIEPDKEQAKYNAFVRSIAFTKPREFKVKGGSSCRATFKHYVKVKPKRKSFNISETLFGQVLKAVNTRMLAALFDGIIIKLPLNTGYMFIEKYEVEPKIVNGKLVFRKDVNWGDTYKLWYNDPDAFASKLLVRYNDRVVYRVKYVTRLSRFANKRVVMFRPQRSLKQQLKNKIKANQIEGYYKRKRDYGNKVYKYKNYSG